jgi:hypothetical protein
MNDIDYPVNVLKLINNVKSLKSKINNHKQELDNIIKIEVKNIDKLLDTILEKNIKTIEKKKERKPSGFAVPAIVSNELCLFMNIENNTLVSRTQATKYIINYIKDNKLQNPLKKKYIIPDNKLKILLGQDIQNLTHFNIQKYLNKHFIKK